MGRLLICAALMLLVCAPAARAQPIALRDDLAARHVALAGSEVLVVRERRDGSTELQAVALHGGARRTLLSVPAGPDWQRTLLAASRERVGFVVERNLVEAVETRVYSGPPSGPLELVHRVTDGSDNPFLTGLVDVDGDRLLLVEGTNDAREVRARVLEPGFGWVPVAWAGPRLVPVAIAGQHAAAFIVDRRRPWRVARVALVDRATGTEQASIAAVPGEPPDADDFDVAGDGRIVAKLSSGLWTARDGEPARRVPGSRRLEEPRFAGAHIAALESGRSATWPVLLRPDGQRGRLGDPTGRMEDFAADDQGIAWLANGCLRYAAIAGPPPVAPATDPCPTTEIGFHTDNNPRLRGRTIRVPVLCITAPGDVCRGTVLIRHRGRTVGRGRFAIPVGRRPRIDVRLTRRGLRLVHGRNPRMRIGARIADGRIGPSRGATDLSVEVP